jgi:type IV pilus assembly protein PilE
VRLATPAALRSERGFTLVELLVVIIVIGILSLVAFASYLNYRERANDAAAQANLQGIVPSVHAYFVDNGTYVGMTIAGLEGYDSTIDPARFSLGTAAPTQSTYCIDSSSQGHTWRKNGPSAAFEPQPCP